MKCYDCPRNCGADRSTSLGFCGEGDRIRVAKIIENFMWEEPCLTGTKGALAIFFSGCNLRCEFCQNYKISHKSVGKTYNAEEFARLLNSFDLTKYSCIDLVTPDHFSSLLIDALALAKPTIPVVWNCSGYQKRETLHRVAAVADIFLVDLKFYDSALSRQMCGAMDYFDVASAAIKAMAALKPNVFDGDNMRQGVIIRHLILPGQCRDSIKLLDFVKNEVEDPIISVMSQFTPTPDSPIKRGISVLELKTVLAHAQKLGLTRGYFQDLDSCSTEFIPKF